MKEKEAIGIEIIKDNRKLLIYANKEMVLSSGTINSQKSNHLRICIFRLSKIIDIVLVTKFLKTFTVSYFAV
jgi:hypothetical protein